MNHFRISALTLVASMAAGVGTALGDAPGNYDGELLTTHSCIRHGYMLRVIKPSNTGPDARQIAVSPSNKYFHATWNEVSNLIGNHPVDDLDYTALASNPGPDGERYCVRTGHLIPTHETVYGVSLRHYNDYNGNSSVFFDSNAEVATITHLINKYNTNRNQGDPLPATCKPMTCLDGASGVSGSGSGNSGWSPGTHTTADGEVKEIFDLNPPSSGDDNDNPPVRPSVNRTEAIRSLPGTATDSGKDDDTKPVRMERSRSNERQQ